MTGESVVAGKRALRERAGRLPEPEGPDAATEIQSRLLALPELRRARWVAVYAAAGHEVPLDRVVAESQRSGVGLAFPRVMGDDLSLFAAGGLDALLPGSLGILEPGPDAIPVAVDRVDVFLVPGLLFDRRGRRLGRGGGHYDRLLGRARPNALRVGICYAERVMAEIPAEEWDIPMDLVVTESEVIRPGGTR